MELALSHPAAGASERSPRAPVREKLLLPFHPGHRRDPMASMASLLMLEDAPAARVASGRAVPMNHAGATVLLVDDDPAVRRATRRLLERGGFVVLEADTPAQALALARAHVGPIDLLLTDVMMPGLNGNQLAFHLVEERPGVRVLFMSGFSEAEAVRRGVTGPGYAFLPKPYDPATLPWVVDAVLSGGDA